MIARRLRHGDIPPFGRSNHALFGGSAPPTPTYHVPTNLLNLTYVTFEPLYKDLFDYTPTGVLRTLRRESALSVKDFVFEWIATTPMLEKSRLLQKTCP